MTLPRLDRLLACGIVAAVAVSLAMGAAAARAADDPLAPSLSLDQRFAPPDGVAMDDLSTPGSAIPSAVAVDGDRIYTVGQLGSSTDADIAIVARRTDGTYDGGFSGDGKLILPIAAGTAADIATDVVVLPDHHLRILASTALAPGSSTKTDVALVGLAEDGSFDTGFGTGGSGKVVFPAAALDGKDAPSRMAIGPDGRIAVTGGASDGSKDDLFVSLREPNGAPVAGFGSNPMRPGVVVLNRGGGTLNDRGTDVEFRPGGGILALVQVETNPSDSVNDYVAVLRAFDETGAPDTRFNGTGDLVLPVGSPDTNPSSLIAYGGRIWVAGSTHVALDVDAFLARLNADGSGVESRRFDMRGTAIPANQLVVSSANDLDVVPGPSPTLVVAGNINYNNRPYWALAGFRSLDGPLWQATYGDLLVPTQQWSSLSGMAASPAGWAAIGGPLIDPNNNFNVSFGTGRLLLDADKKCDLGLEIVAPLELTMRGTASAAITLRVTNAGSLTCGGTLTAPAPYGLQGAPLTIGPLAPGASQTTSGMRLAYAGPRRREDQISLAVRAPGDTSAQNDSQALKVRFAYCDIGLSTVGAAPVAPIEGERTYELSVRNAGTSPCTSVRIVVARGGSTGGGQEPFTLPPGRSASVDVRAAVARGGRPGARARLTFRSLATGDVDAGNDTATLSPRLAGVGDSEVRGASARRFHGTASGAGARSGLKSSQRRLRRVEIAVERTGKTCRSLAGGSGRLRAGKGRTCRHVWLPARGARAWSFGLRRALPAGTYVVSSRAVIAAGFAEGSFTRADHNRVTFRVP